MGREVSIKSDWPIHDQKGNIEPESTVQVAFTRKYQSQNGRHFFKTEDMYISASLFKKLIKEHGIKPKWKEYIEKTTPQGVVMKDEQGKTLKEFVNVDASYVDRVTNAALNTKEEDQ